jgi:cytochrome c oxidase subunit 2
MTPELVFWVLVALGVVWTAAWAIVLVRSRPGPGFDVIEPVENRLRLRLLIIFGGIGLVLFALTLHAYPYLRFRERALGAPRETISVLGVQWGWSLSRNTVPARVPVEFVVRSKDVNHDFAIYDPGGVLLVQVQAMPGYANRLIYRFERPGTYMVRCLEYCGIFHHIMFTTLVVR